MGQEARGEAGTGAAVSLSSNLTKKLLDIPVLGDRYSDSTVSRG